MSLDIDSTRREGVTILRLAGELRLGEAASFLRETVRLCIAEGQSRVLLNVEKVRYVDSAGLGDVFASYRAAREAGGDLGLVNLPEQIRELLDITHLSSILPIFEDEATALKTFGNRGSAPRAR